MYTTAGGGSDSDMYTTAGHEAPKARHSLALLRLWFSIAAACSPPFLGLGEFVLFYRRFRFFDRVSSLYDYERTPSVSKLDSALSGTLSEIACQMDIRTAAMISEKYRRNNITHEPPCIYFFTAEADRFRISADRENGPPTTTAAPRRETAATEAARTQGLT